MLGYQEKKKEFAFFHVHEHYFADKQLGSVRDEEARILQVRANLFYSMIWNGVTGFYRHIILPK